ncbi:MAG: hypothetical protein HOV66_20285, partial [Streptomycetaceae bacterium]|nr:hypothetical protein [Streptomycetaceae bacterium]
MVSPLAAFHTLTDVVGSPSRSGLGGWLAAAVRTASAGWAAAARIASARCA